jgi:hypothetical protein
LLSLSTENHENNFPTKCKHTLKPKCNQYPNQFSV